MITKHRARVKKDAANNRISVVKEIDAPVEKVWEAWTDSKVLDKWWAPKPWRAETKKMDFRPGGKWEYAMVGPNGERHGALIEYKTIAAPNLFTGVDSFTDEGGNKQKDMPSMEWENKFVKTDHGTKLEVEIKFNSKADLDKILEMGFEEGFTMGLDNLDELLAK